MPSALRLHCRLLVSQFWHVRVGGSGSIHPAQFLHCLHSPPGAPHPVARLKTCPSQCVSPASLPRLPKALSPPLPPPHLTPWFLPEASLLGFAPTCPSPAFLSHKHNPCSQLSRPDPLMPPSASHPIPHGWARGTQLCSGFSSCLSSISNLATK